jgi:hypothetical protein
VAFQDALTGRRLSLVHWPRRVLRTSRIMYKRLSIAMYDKCHGKMKILKPFFVSHRTPNPTFRTPMG